MPNSPTTVGGLLDLNHRFLREAKRLSPHMLAKILIWDLHIGEVMACKHANCNYCSEPITLHEVNARSVPMPLIKNSLRDYHSECIIRAVLGSAAHMLSECSCFGGTREDPPGMSLRDAARLAADVFWQTADALKDEEEPNAT